MRQVILIHGAWATPFCWRFFRPALEELGFATLAPAWPWKDRPYEEQLRDPDRRLAQTGIPEIVEHYKAIVRRQAEPPVLIGHSFGGLIVQLLLGQGFGAAGIAVSSVPPRGVSPFGWISRQTLKLAGSFLRRPPGRRMILQPPEAGDPERVLREVWSIETHLVPESARIFWQLCGAAAQVDRRNHVRAPLLLVACGRDAEVAVETCRRNYDLYRFSRARTDFALFPELSHFSIAEPGRQMLAAYCAQWIFSLNSPPSHHSVTESDCLYSH